MPAAPILRVEHKNPWQAPIDVPLVAHQIIRRYQIPLRPNPEEIPAVAIQPPWIPDTTGFASLTVMGIHTPASCRPTLSRSHTHPNGPLFRQHVASWQHDNWHRYTDPHLQMSQPTPAHIHNAHASPQPVDSHTDSIHARPNSLLAPLVKSKSDCCTPHAANSAGAHVHSSR